MALWDHYRWQIFQLHGYTSGIITRGNKLPWKPFRKCIEKLDEWVGWRRVREKVLIKLWAHSTVSFLALMFSAFVRFSCFSSSSHIRHPAVSPLMPWWRQRQLICRHSDKIMTYEIRYIIHGSYLMESLVCSLDILSVTMMGNMQAHKRTCLITVSAVDELRKERNFFLWWWKLG